MTGQDGAEKSHEPTQKRLDDARKRGEVVRSNDLTFAAAQAGLLLVAMGFGAASLIRAATLARGLVEQADTLAPALVSPHPGPVAGGIVLAFGAALAPWFAVPLVAVLAMLLAQRAVVFSGEKLMPKLSRISPLANARNKFGRAGLFEFAKSAVKLGVISLVLGFYLTAKAPVLLGAVQLPPGAVVALIGHLLIGFLLIVLAVTGAIGALDYLWQYHEHRRRNRMSHQELLEENRQSEGDPHMKQQRRRKGYEIATNRMLAEVPAADVVIVNPTHYAVALKWNRAARGAPVCVAKGVDEVAARIRAAAVEAGVPIRSDPPTARVLHAAVEVGQQIRPEHYQAVAAAIRFAETMRRRARRGGR